MIEEMEVGKKYRIITIRGTKKRPITESQVAIYLGIDCEGEHEVSLRPLGGTNHIPQDWIISLDETDKPIQLPKRVNFSEHS